MNKKTFLMVSIILFSFIPFMAGHGQESDWILEKRGANFKIYYDVLNPLQKRWNPEPTWVYNGTEYVPYIYYRDEAKKCYTIQSGLISAEIYDTGIATFYDPYLSEERVKSELWEVWFLDKAEWKKATLSSVISFNITQEQKTITIESKRTTSKPDGILTIQYLFTEGNPLKHTVNWESTSTSVETIQVRQVWNLKLSTSEVLLDDGSILTESTKTNETTYIFGDADNDFIVKESQWAATYYPNGTLRENGFIESDIDLSGKKVTFLFGNWILAYGETLEIDPATSTNDDPIVDGTINNDYGTYTRTTVGNAAYIGKCSSSIIRRSFVEWSISTIPDEATITNVVFKYHGSDGYGGDEEGRIREMLGTRPSTTPNDNAGNQAIYDETAEGTEYADPPGFPIDGENKQVDLASSTNADLQNQLDDDWFALGFKGELESYPSGSLVWFFQEDYEDANPKPTLYVTYTIPAPEITSATILNMDDGDNLYPMYDWYSFKVVTEYTEGADKITKVYLRGMNEAQTIFEVRGDSLNSTPAWSIQTGSDIIDLDSGSCSWSINGNEGNATFKIRVEYDHTQYSDMGIDVYAEGENELSYGWINAQTDYYDTISNIVTTFSLGDDRGNLSQSITATGQVTFEGSSLHPDDSNFTGVSVYDSNDNNKGTDSTIIDGQWSITFNAPSSVGIETYNAYLDLVPDYPDGEEITPTDSFITDRYNVTSFWASEYNPPTGDNVTLYATFESEYDSHICDGDDSITIENLQFTYDPIEEYFFTEVGKDENGTYYFDTLNSIYENTYEVYDGNLDYNLSITWGVFKYDFYGLFYENGTNAGNVTLSVYFDDTIDIFLLEGNVSKNYNNQSVMVNWPLTGGASRVIYFVNDTETNYIFTPDGEYSAYAFTIKDYTGVIGKGNSYLETILIVNGTEHLIERPLIWDTANPVTAVLQKDNRYKLQIRDGNGAVHVFDYYLPIVGVTPELIIDEIAFTEQVHYVGEYVSVEAVRPDYEHIQINYKDERSATTSIFVEICFMNQTQIWNSTSTDQYVQFNWYDAVNTTDYLINLVAQHTIVEEVLYSNALAGYYEQYDDPPDMGIFGASGKYLVPVGILMLVLAVADARTAKMVTTAMVGVAYVLKFIGWLDVPVMGIHLSLFLVGAWWLSGRM